VVWFCPTLGRPKRLKQLAKSWERCEPNTPLHVRLYVHDTRMADYKAMRWPKNWFFYTSDKLRCGPALNEFYHDKNPTADSYGFIADDIVLRTKGGLGHLEALAEPYFIAYPNDTLQREKLCTHFCIGGALVRELGWFSLPGLQQSIDMPWMYIGMHTSLLRYAPNVVFQHKHFLNDGAPKDATYSMVYAGNSTTPTADFIQQDTRFLEKYMEKQIFEDVVKIKKMLFVDTEDPQEWDEQDAADRIIVMEKA